MGRTPAAILSIIRFFPAHKMDSAYPAVSPKELYRRCHGNQLHALFHGFGNFILAGRHIPFRPAVNHGHITASQADCCPGHIHGRASASDYHQLIGNSHIPLQANPLKEPKAAFHAL